jgi:hypothetical protein
MVKDGKTILLPGQSPRAAGLGVDVRSVSWASRWVSRSVVGIAARIVFMMTMLQHTQRHRGLSEKLCAHIQKTSSSSA